MAEVLVLVDHVDGQVRKVTAELLTLARSLGTPSAVFVGSNVDAARPRLAQFGAEKVYVIDSAEVDGHPAPLAEALAAVVGRPRRPPSCCPRRARTTRPRRASPSRPTQV